MRRVEMMSGGEDFNSLTAGDFMQSEVHHYSENTLATILMSAITVGGFGSVPITAEGKILVGLVSEFDLLKAIMAKADFKNMTAKDIMTKDVIAVTEDAPVEKIMSLLQFRHLIRVPVINEKGVLVGIVARRDILYGYLKLLKTPPPLFFDLP